jgi:hypothetical protein
MTLKKPRKSSKNLKSTQNQKSYQDQICFSWHFQGKKILNMRLPHKKINLTPILTALKVRIGANIKFFSLAPNSGDFLSPPSYKKPKK